MGARARSALLSSLIGGARRTDGRTDGRRAAGWDTDVLSVACASLASLACLERGRRRGCPASVLCVLATRRPCLSFGDRGSEVCKRPAVCRTWCVRVFVPRVVRLDCCVGSGG